jgi:hypothetical protein
MKKLALSLVVGAALALTPLSSFALTAMSDANMKDATGQAGVSIAVDEIVLYQYVGETMYIDTDGVDGLVSDAAAVTISDKETFTTMRALLDNTNRGGKLKDAFGGTGYANILNGTADTNVGTRTGVTLEMKEDGTALKNVEHIEIAALSIDVASAALVSTKINDEDTAAVVIGLPTLEICKSGDIQTIGVWGCSIDGTKSTTNGGTLIQIEKEDSVMTILGGTLEIAAH